MTATVYWFICVRESYLSALPIAAGTQQNFNRATVNAVQNLRNRRHAVGDLLPRPTGDAVQDHLLCDGSAIDRVSFNQLFAYIGTQFGTGDGVTTFNIPDLVSEPVAPPVDVPTQVISDGGTVSTGAPVETPSDPGQTGGSTGGNIQTGGRTKATYPNAANL